MERRNNINMKRIKYIFVVLILISLSVHFYQNYIYYKLPYNPLAELDSDPPISCYFTEYRSDSDIIRSSHDLNTNNLVFNYFRDLNLIPLKKHANRDEIFEHTDDTYFSYMLQFGQSKNYRIFIDEIWPDNLTILNIRSNKRYFPDGYYKIVDSKFDYTYVNDLIINSEQ